MGQKENRLRDIFRNCGAYVTSGHLPFPRIKDVLDSEYNDDVDYIYRKLGGMLKEIPLGIRKWDMEINGIAVELDEERHFNRYREITLNSKVYTFLPCFPLHEYRECCKLYEPNCLKSASYGGYWTNASCEKQFGSASKPGKLDGNGAPRWKQRAFYDFVKDLAPLIIGVPLVRISIWDKVLLNDSAIVVKEILEMANIEAAAVLLKLFSDRTHLHVKHVK